MAWTTPPTKNTGDLMDATWWNIVKDDLEYLLDPNKERILRTQGTGYTTTSTSFVDVDATNLAITMTTYGGPVLVMATGAFFNNTTAKFVSFDIDVDGTRLGEDDGLQRYKQETASYPKGLCLVALVTGLEAGSHTFKLQWRVDAGTATLQSVTSYTPVQLAAIEL